jgi:hypothetical protein
VVQRVAPAGRRDGRHRSLREHRVIHVADAVEREADDGEDQDRADPEGIDEEQREHHARKQARLEPVEAVGRERRRHHRAVMGDVHVAVPPGAMEQAVAGVEVDLVPEHHHAEVQGEAPRRLPPADRDPSRAIGGDGRHAVEREDGDGDERPRRFAADLARAQRPAIDDPPDAQARQRAARGPGRHDRHAEVQRGEGAGDGDPDQPWRLPADQIAQPPEVDHRGTSAARPASRPRAMR